MFAINQNGQLIDLSKYSASSLKELKKDTYYCRDCCQPLFIRKGKKQRAHFVHYSEKTRPKSESEKHYLAKHALFAQFKKQHKDVSLEFYLKDHQIQPDILIQDKTLHAIEFQASRLSSKLISKRNKKYEVSGFEVTWILDDKFFKVISRNRIKIDASIKPFIKQINYNLKLFFYASETKKLIICDYLVFDSPTSAYAQISQIKLNQMSLEEIKRERKVTPSLLYQVWLKSLNKFRSRPKQTNRKSFTWYNWLYEKGYFHETIPSEIYLPVVHSHLYDVPVWIWQGSVIDMLNKEFQVGDCVEQERIEGSLMIYIYPYLKHETYLIKESVRHYLNQLVKCEVLLLEDKKYYKLRKVQGQRSLIKALNKDNVIIEQLRYNLSNI